MKRMLSLLLILLLFMAGCAAAPDKITIDGVDKAISQSEEAAMDLDVETDIASVLEALPDEINTTIQGENSTLSIAAKVQPVNIDSVYTAILQPITYDEEKLINFCFAEQAPNAIRDGSQQDQGSVEYYIWEDETAGQIAALDLYSNGELFYYSDTLAAQYSSEDKAQQENAPNCSLSKEDAILFAKNYLAGLGIDSIDITKATAYVADHGAGKGFYSLRFHRKLFRIPFVARGTTAGMNPPQGTMFVAEEGVITLSGNFMFEAVNSTPIDQILSLEDILSLIPNMMDTRIKTQSDTPVEEISLRYIVKANENDDPKLVPVWFFDIDQEAAKAVIGDQDEYLIRGSQDLMFNALTGQLEK